MFTLKQEPSRPSWVVGSVFLTTFSFKSLVGGGCFLLICLFIYLFAFVF